MNLWTDGFVGAIIGAILGGSISAWAAIRVVNRQLAADRDRRADDERAHLKSLGAAVKLELETVQKIHLDGVGAELEECRSTNNFFGSYYPIYSDYFTLFEGNSDAIGRTPPHIAQRIVQAYIHLKALVDTFRFNNAMLDRVEEFALRNVPESDGRVIDLIGQLKEYGPKLLASHDRAMKSVEDAIAALEGV